MSVLQFRTDINGLRAIAVIAVVLFHFNASWVPGGFAGVDVFFVISGFLMTGIIFKGIEQGNFSILKFYVARANRIIPALAVLCLFLLILGWFYFSPLEYKELGKHVASSIGFLSNITYWRESGYFEAASHEKWLLHTWSLSVEWQFYIIYPLALVILRKFIPLNKLKAAVIFGTLLGFILGVVFTYKWPNPAYYLLPSRAWEMMIGGVAYLYPIVLSNERKKRLEKLGVALIIGSYFFISQDNPWPGYLALLPVLGTFFIIQAHRDDSFLTNNIVFQKLGAWSYSIYLWHWPVVVAIYYFSLNDTFIYLGITLSILLGYLSHKYVEKIKFRNDFGHLLSYLKCKPFYIFLIICSIGLVSYMHQFDLRPQNEDRVLGHYYIDATGELVFNDDNQVHVLNENGDFDMLMVGDSNSAHYSYGITSSDKVKVSHRWSGSCFAFLDMNTQPYDSWMDESWKTYCHSLYEFVDFNKGSPVIIAQQWSDIEMECVRNCATTYTDIDYKTILKKELDKIISYIGNRPVFLIGQLPVPEESMVKCMKSFHHDSCQRVSPKPVDRLTTNKHLEAISRSYDNVFFIDPFNALCNVQNECSTIINNKNVFYDAGGHLSAFGSKKVWPYIESEIIKKLGGE